MHTHLRSLAIDTREASSFREFTCNGCVDPASPAFVVHVQIIVEEDVVLVVEVLLNLQDGEDSIDGQQHHDSHPPRSSIVKVFHKQCRHYEEELEPAMEKMFVSPNDSLKKKTCSETYFQARMGAMYGEALRSSTRSQNANGGYAVSTWY